EERRGDLRAQRAACAAGAAGWRALVARHGAERLAAAADALLDYTANRARAAALTLGTRRGRARDALEGDGVSTDDVAVVIAVDLHDGKLRFDFTGTSPQVRGNVNCPLAVTRAAAVFVLRTLLDDD